MHLQVFVLAIAERTILAVLATTEIHSAAIVRFVFNGNKFTALMGAVTKRLFLAFPAGAPPVAFTSLDIYCIGCFLGNLGF